MKKGDWMYIISVTLVLFAYGAGMDQVRRDCQSKTSIVHDTLSSRGYTDSLSKEIDILIGKLNAQGEVLDSCIKRYEDVYWRWNELYIESKRVQ